MEREILIRGGVYLAKLDPAKAAEVGKIRPVVILTAQALLDIAPPIIFICPLSSQSKPEFSSLHVKLKARDNIKLTSYALTEHCRSMTINRILYPRLGQLMNSEIVLILERLQRLIGI